jgi:membrane dipeptidase
MRRVALLLAAISALTFVVAAQTSSSGVSPQAAQVHSRAIVLDTHADTTQRMVFDPRFNIGERHSDGNIDIPRMRDGGMDALFFSIWVPSDVTGPPAVKRAFDQIDAVREAVRTHPNDLVLATTVADVRKAAADKKIAALMGMEGGHMIDDDMRLLRDYYALGVRYMTLTHFKNNNWADSSTDKPAHNGLTAFGKDVVREMNRLGMLVDLSHVSDATMVDAIRVSRAPVFFSHSSARALCNHVRNVPDSILAMVKANGGVVMVNFNPGFVSEAVRLYEDSMAARARALRTGGADSAAIADSTGLWAARAPKATLAQVADHIDHIRAVAGVDHVGLGSDFDGITSVPAGLEDVSKFPDLVAELLRRGWSEQDVRKVVGLNALRVMRAAERVAAEMRKG